MRSAQFTPLQASDRVYYDNNPKKAWEGSHIPIIITFIYLDYSDLKHVTAVGTTIFILASKQLHNKRKNNRLLILLVFLFVYSIIFKDLKDVEIRLGDHV